MIIRTNNILGLTGVCSVQVSDAELEDIVKMSSGSMPPPEGSMRGSAATQALVGDYSAALMENRATPLRTPLQENVILQEARNLRILRDTNPLLDHQNDVEMPELQGGFGFDGVDPRATKLATPNTVLTTPMIGAPEGDRSVRSNATSSRWGAAPSSVLRDQFGLNHAENMSETASVMSVAESQLTMTSRIRDKELRAMISAQLKSLPEPEYTYDIAIPEVEKEIEEGDVQQEKPIDAAEALAQLEAERAEEIRLELARRSAVIKRDLPRPVDASLKALQSRDIGASNSSVSADLSAASALVNAEVARLIARDAYRYPDRASTGRVQPIDLPEIDDDLMKQAKSSISQEVSSIESLSAYGGTCPLDSFETVWDDVHRGLTYTAHAEKNSKVSDMKVVSSLSKNEVFFLVPLY